MSKFNNKKTFIDGILFDSIKESLRYHELGYLLKAKQITNLVLQPKFILQDKFTDESGKKHAQITYTADFKYLDKQGNAHVEDVKGYRTDVYRLKVKMLLNKYKGFYFHEV